MAQGGTALVPTPGGVHDPDDREHDRDFHQHADHGRERGPGLEAEQADRGRDRELEKVAGADQGGGRGDAVRDTELAAQQVGEPELK